MRKNAMHKNLRQSILNSLGRYIAIVLIIALGSSIFVGLLMTKTDMVATGQEYMDQQQMFDLRLASNYGWGREQLEEISRLPGVEAAEGQIFLDVIASIQGLKDDAVFRFYAIPEQLDQISLQGGRMPQSPDECLIDGYIVSDEILGSKVTVSEYNKEDTLDSLVYKTYTIVGYIASPLYMDMNRGTTSIGSGSLETFLYFPAESFDVDYYSEIHVTIPGDYDVYSEDYNDAMKAAAEDLEPLLEPLADARFQKVRSDAIQAYHDGLLEYFEGVKDFHDAEAEVEEELEEAHQKLLDAEDQILEAEKELVRGEAQLRSAKNQLYEAQKELDAGREEYEEQKALYEQLLQTVELLQTGRGSLVRRIGDLEVSIQQINAQIEEMDQSLLPDENSALWLDISIADLGVKISLCDSTIQATQDALALANRFPKINALLISQLENNIAALQADKASYEQQRSEKIAQREQLRGQEDPAYQERMALEAEKLRLQTEKSMLQNTLSIMDSTMSEAESAIQTMLDAFESAEAELEAGQQQIDAGWAMIRENEKKLEDGKRELEEGKLELEEGWKEYEEGKAEAERELEDARIKLADGKAELDDARRQIQDMKLPSLYILDRNSNTGYCSLESSSDIVQGVSRAIPVFFLLVASLVCITTMTRMIDEERTQIGTLKALGYSNGAIISKYLVYAGSGALIGCGVGVLAGSAVFPVILWEAYKVMLYIPQPIVLKVNWTLCAIVVFTYTAVMLFVTWYCCRKALQEQPAELIRPKAPDPGKKILLERLKLWNRVSFLNKVMIRNIFRYRQRLAMMMVGIGGCTALLLTGFGLRDSITNVVNYQFGEVTVYDLQVYFENGRTQADQAQFLEDVGTAAEGVLFYHQESVELDFGGATKELYLMVSDSRIMDFVDYHSGKTSLEMPGLNEVLLSVGAAEAMGIEIGDEISLRNPDMESLKLTVSGIYDNHVYNYVLVTPETVEAQWGRTPQQQMALIQVQEGQDPHELSAKIAGMVSVMNVSVSEDLADMVDNMMDALDLVIWVVVFCAGLLAAIVLYNLTNININERIREIATIKVLGFNAGETGAYVFEENLTLTAVGSVFGLGLGYLMLLFVMDQIKIDMVWFKALVNPISYALSLVLTMVAACIVDYVFYFKLDKINMAEALKSVE